MKKKQSFENNSLSHMIAEKITQQIMLGELKPGEKIIETDYAEEFGTSRAPIRESLYLLATEGLIERIPRKGAVVKGYNEFEIHDLLEIRIELESLALKRVETFGMNEEIFNEMKELVHKMSAIEDKNEYAYLNKEFHTGIIRMSNSSIIQDMYKRLGKPLLTLQRISLHEEEHIRKSIEDHTKIMQLLSEGQFEQARDILAAHNQAGINRIKHKLFEDETSLRASSKG